jgi:hypothetical protein
LREGSGLIKFRTEITSLSSGEISTWKRVQKQGKSPKKELFFKKTNFEAIIDP